MGFLSDLLFIGGLGAVGLLLGGGLKGDKPIKLDATVSGDEGLKFFEGKPDVSWTPKPAGVPTFGVGGLVPVSRAGGVYLVPASIAAGEAIVSKKEATVSAPERFYNTSGGDWGTIRIFKDSPTVTTMTAINPRDTRSPQEIIAEMKAGGK